MSFIKNKFMKIFSTFLAACGVSTYFVACYGMPSIPKVAERRDFAFDVKIFGDIDNDGILEPIPNILLSSHYGYNAELFVKTDKEGLATFYSFDGDVITISDEDGEENGSFENQLYHVNKNEILKNEFPIRIEMTQKSKE